MKKTKQSISLFAYFQMQVDKLKLLGKFGTADTYLATMRSLRKFYLNKEVLLSDLDKEQILQYEAFLLKNGLQKNTSSFYIRVLRAIYNKAVDDGIVDSKNIFRNVYTGIDKTIKRALSKEEISRIKNIDLGDDFLLNFSRDIFMFSFYTRGMSFIDIAYLKKSDIYSVRLYYRRRKTGQLLSVRIESCMQCIIDKYSQDNSKYVFPIIRNQSIARNNYKSMLHTVNSQLKRLSLLLKLKIPLSMYVARHSWATIAKENNIPLAVISEGMGHASEQITQIYLASLNSSIIDAANKMVIEKL